MSLMARLKKTSTIKQTATLDKSEFLRRVSTPTDVPMINVALSGDMAGGLVSGLTCLAGPSKHFKTSFALLMAGAYMKKHDDAICVFYDTEFGSPQDYFTTFGINPERVLHTPITDLEELKFDMVKQLEEITESDRVIIIIDSVGNIASKKELDDAMDGKSVADMSRAKAMKGLFRMITPKLKMKDIPLIAINHTYKEIGLFPKDIVSGGTGIYYSADTIWILGRRQNKTGTEVTGYDFVINVEKSRFVKEKSKIPVTVSWDGGVERYSGLLDIALLSGHVTKPSNGWYQKVNTETGEILGSKVREKETKTAEFWADILEDEKFQDFVRNLYKIQGDSEFDATEIVDVDPT